MKVSKVFFVAFLAGQVAAISFSPLAGMAFILFCSSVFAASARPEPTISNVVGILGDGPGYTTCNRDSGAVEVFNGGRQQRLISNLSKPPPETCEIFYNSRPKLNGEEVALRFMSHISGRLYRELEKKCGAEKQTALFNALLMTQCQPLVTTADSLGLGNCHEFACSAALKLREAGMTVAIVISSSFDHVFTLVFQSQSDMPNPLQQQSIDALSSNVLIVDQYNHVITSVGLVRGTVKKFRDNSWRSEDVHTLMPKTAPETMKNTKGLRNFYRHALSIFKIDNAASPVSERCQRVVDEVVKSFRP